MRLPAGLLAGAALLLLGGCQVPSAPPRPAPTRLLPVPPSVPPPPPPAAREPAVWHFASGPAACTAQAIGRTARLQVTLRAGHPMEFTLSAPRGVVRRGPTTSGGLRFQGPAGEWAAQARIGPGSLAVAALPLNDQAVGRVSLLLAGGTLAPFGAGAALPALVLPPAGAAGRHWFACARGLLS